jgi:uncharacterized membrane protein
MVGRKGNDMAWEILLGTDIGLLSLFTIVFIICIAVYLFFFMRNRIRDEEQQQKLKQKA